MLGGTWQSTHNFHFEAWVNRLQVPRSNTQTFAPKLTVYLKNVGDLIEHATISVEVTRYEGAVSAMGNVTEGWQSDKTFQVHDWKQEDTKKFQVKISEHLLPTPGSYIIRVLLDKRVHEDPEVARQFIQLWNDAMRQRRMPPELPDSSQRSIDGSSGSLSLEGDQAYRTIRVLKATPIHYFHVHPLATSIAFLGVAIGALAAIATIVRLVL
jgi:hypothetical protein